MNIAVASIENKTITLTITFLIIVGGYFSYNKMGRLEDPEFTIKSAQVITNYPGATAIEVAEEVTDTIETAIQKLGQVDEVTSLSQPGLSIITVDIKDKYDKNSLPQVWDELRRKVNDVQGELPPGTSISIVYDDYGDVYGVYYAIYGNDYSYAELKEHAKMLRKELLLVKDVADVTLQGDQQEVVYVEITRARLAQLGISPELVLSTLTGQNLAAPSGKIRIGDKYVRIQPSGETKSVEEIGDLLILQNDGSPTKLRIKDVAKVKRGYVDPPGFVVRFNGNPAIGLGISTVEGGNVVVMGDAVSKRINELMAETPVGIEMGVISHQASAVKTAISGFVISLLEAIAIVVGVLMIAMGLRSSLIIGAILLLTILATFIVMLFEGVLLERISLGALIIALGMLVDNAIVVVEGIIINTKKGMKPIDGAKQIVSQTMWPLFGATIVAVLAFAAIGASQDSTGEYCRSLFKVILISLMVSWVLAITITPLLCIMFLSPAKQSGEDDPYSSKFFILYKSFLKLCIRFRAVTMISLICFLAASFYGFRYVRKSFFPPSTRPQFMVHYWMPQGTHIDKTDNDLNKITEELRKIDGVKNISSFAGGGALRFLLTYTPEDKNTAYGLMLVDVDNYKRIDEIINESQLLIDENHPDAQAFCRKFQLGPGEAQKIAVRFRGPDIEVLQGLANQAINIFVKSSDTTDVMSDWRDKVPMVRPLVAENQARNVGVTRKQIAAALQSGFTGTRAGLYREADELLPIIVRGPDEERLDVANLKDVRIWSPVAASYIPISQVLRGVDFESEFTIVRRKNRVSTVTVKCDPARGEASVAFKELRPVIESKIKLPIGYSMEWGGEYEDSSEAQAGLISKIPFIVILMILTVIFLFNSIRKPLVIFMNVPLAAIGVSLGLLLTNQPFGFMALLGYMSLAGMLIKNAIVLIDEINAQLANGKEPYDAIVDAGVSRLRPVSMAALTTVLGMIPLLTDAFFIAMAVTIMFGLTFATVLTLVVVPVLYSMFYKIPILLKKM